MGVGILVASHLFGQKARRSKIKDSPYECGLAAEVGGETRYSVKFYITAMLFILFDIDVVFLIPWVLTHRDRYCGRARSWSNDVLYFRISNWISL